MGSTQSGVIFGGVLFAFFVYITLKGELPTYAGLLLLSPQTGGSNSSAQQQTSAAANSLAGALAAGL